MKAESNTNTSKIYFSNLDAVRFIAAFLVLIFHIEIKRKQFGIDFYDSFFFVTGGGDYGVTIFFVLSGFLITYLLISEKTKTSTINIPKFYIRRILRIWPLYFLMVIVGFFVLPQLDIFFVPQTSHLWMYLSIPTFLLFVFFLPNVIVDLYGNMPYLDQLWSIGVEEQYYLFWPLIMKRTKDTILKFIFFIFCGVLVSKTLLVLIDFNLIEVTSSIRILADILGHERFACMGIGGLGAYLLFNKERYSLLTSFLQRRSIQLITIMFVVYFIVMSLKTRTVIVCLSTYSVMWFIRNRLNDRSILVIGVLFFYIACKGFGHIPTTIINNRTLDIFDNEILSVLICISIINLASNTTSVINAKNSFLLYLGRISYGIYVYHNVLIVLGMYLSTKLFVIPYNRSFVYAFSIVSTISISALSYELFEKHFLKIKKKYMVIKSGA